MIKKWVKGFEIFFILLIIIIFWSYILYFYTPEELVQKIGVTNGYIFLFLSAALGGVSTLTSSSFYTTVFTLVSGGLNPYLAGIIGGIGVSIGDSLFYYLGYRGRKITSEKLNEKIEHLSQWIKNQKTYKVQLFIFLYCGFAPTPNDLIIIPLGLNHYNFKKIVWPMILGNITFTTVFGLVILYLPNLI